ncbi:GlcG/HbpS family heme-binding protein [Brenneria corticis]|uniref:Heme-binding protein n=1 Tax=Brenneria corticis TaxID=2173106 RepID=A0A2U1UBE0_9GAMM|nr:heme-binding protein [Brenneria sp. CFCC 11842]PWC18996.1 heme-binding protein [Brenneria sp. CFCC 11842]
MPEQTESIIIRHALDDVAVSRRVALFLQTTVNNPSTQGLAIAVVGLRSELIAFGAHAACPALPRLLAQRKAYTALMFRRSTARIYDEVQDHRLQLQIFNDPQLIAMPGGVPVVWEDRVIGAVGISGLPPEKDVELAEQMAEMLI